MSRVHNVAEAHRPHRLHYGIASGIPSFFDNGLSGPRTGLHQPTPLNTMGPHTNSVFAYASLNTLDSTIYEIQGDITVYPTFTFSGYPTVTIYGPDLEMTTSCLYAYTTYRGTSAPNFVVYNQCNATSQSFAINAAFQSNYLADLSPNCCNIIPNTPYMDVFLHNTGNTQTVFLYNWTTGNSDAIASYTTTSSPSGLITGSRTLEENHGSDSATCRLLPIFSIDYMLYDTPSQVNTLTTTNSTFSYSGQCFPPGMTSPYEEYKILSTSGGSLSDVGYELLQN